MFVSTQAGGTAAELQQGSTFTQARINTYVGLATAPIVLDPVIADLGLTMTAANSPKRSRPSAALNSTLITVTVSNASADESASIANAIADSLATVIPQLEPASKQRLEPRTPSAAFGMPNPPCSRRAPNVPLNLALGACSLAWHWVSARLCFEPF